jgi:hypothetical protein
MEDLILVFFKRFLSARETNFKLGIIREFYLVLD